MAPDEAGASGDKHLQAFYTRASMLHSVPTPYYLCKRRHGSSRLPSHKSCILSRYVPTLTCPVTVYTSTHVVGTPLAQDTPWLPVLFLILVAACLVGGMYAMTKRDINSIGRQQVQFDSPVREGHASLRGSEVAQKLLLPFVLRLCERARLVQGFQLRQFCLQHVPRLNVWSMRRSVLLRLEA